MMWYDKKGINKFLEIIVDYLPIIIKKEKEDNNKKEDI